MHLKHEIVAEVFRIANEEFQRIFMVDMNKKFGNNELLPAEMTKQYALIVSLAAMIIHHNVLREKLQHYGIDIGELPTHF